MSTKNLLLTAAAFSLNASIALAQGGPEHNMQPLQGSNVSGQVGSESVVKMNEFTGNTAMVNRNAMRVHGSPYVDKRWLQAQLVTVNNVKLPQMKLKYDALNQQLLMRPLEHPNDSLRLDDASLVSFAFEVPSAVPGGEPAKRVFRRFAESNIPAQRMQYVEVLHEGKYVLLKRYVKTLRKAAPNTGFNVSTRNEITDAVNYYVCVPGGDVVGGATPVKLTLKGLQSAAPQLAASLAAVPSAKTAQTDAEWVAILAAVDPAK